MVMTTLCSLYKQVQIELNIDNKTPIEIMGPSESINGNPIGIKIFLQRYWWDSHKDHENPTSIIRVPYMYYTYV